MERHVRLTVHIQMVLGCTLHCRVDTILLRVNFTLLYIQLPCMVQKHKDIACLELRENVLLREFLYFFGYTFGPFFFLSPFEKSY